MPQAVQWPYTSCLFNNYPNKQRQGTKRWLLERFLHLRTNAPARQIFLNTTRHKALVILFKSVHRQVEKHIALSEKKVTIKLHNIKAGKLKS